MVSRAVLPMVLLLETALASTPAYAQPPSEHAVKAEFIERFTSFIEWPAHVFADPGGPFVMCFFGHEDQLARYVADLARSRKVKGRTPAFRQIQDPAAVDGCHLVFIGASERRRVGVILIRTRGRPLLTIGDTDGYAEAGVLITLFLDEARHVRFRINVAEARKSGLVFSSKLMKLAVQASAQADASEGG